MSEAKDPSLPELRYLRELAKVFKQYELGEIEIETGEQRILLRRQEQVNAPVASMPAAATTVVPVSAAPLAPAAAPAPAAAAAADASAAPAAAHGDYITCPFVGTFYRAANPESDPFVKVGGSVSPGDTVCIVEAMKLFNEIEAEFPCVIEEILVQDGQAVEFGANLFRVRKL